jgi:hypothetical protein
LLKIIALYSDCLQLGLISLVCSISPLATFYRHCHSFVTDMESEWFIIEMELLQMNLLLLTCHVKLVFGCISASLSLIDNFVIPVSFLFFL